MASNGRPTLLVGASAQNRAEFRERREHTHTQVPRELEAELSRMRTMEQNYQWDVEVFRMAEAAELSNAEMNIAVAPTLSTTELREAVLTWLDGAERMTDCLDSVSSLHMKRLLLVVQNSGTRYMLPSTVLEDVAEAQVDTGAGAAHAHMAIPYVY